MDLDEIVALSVMHKASDLHLCSGDLPWWRRQGRLSVIPDQNRVAHQALEAVAERYLDNAQKTQLSSSGQVDFSLTMAGGQRLRGNLFRQRCGFSPALRLIAAACPDMAALHLPAVVKALLQYQEGLILVTGATGSGKSTTLAAMTEEINQHQARHILTLEDPVEFIYHSGRSLVQQREIGQHCVTFSEGLRAALREDPDVILLGELRDSETIRLALTAAETGHLVLTTLHTRGAAQAVSRLVDALPADEKMLVSAQLAGSLKAVIAQRLEATPDGGRIGLFEVLINTPAVAALIREGKNHQLPGVIQTGSQAGMLTFAGCRQQHERAGRLPAPGFSDSQTSFAE